MALALIALWYAVHSQIGDGIAYFGVVNAAGFFFGAAALVIGTILLVRRDFLGGAAAFALGTLILSADSRYLPLPRPAPPPKSLRFRLVTASLRTANTDMLSAARNLASERPDIIVIQEASDSPALLAELGRVTGHRWYAAGNGLQLTASRWPVTKTGEAHNLTQSDVSTPAGPVRVWNVRASKTFADPDENAVYFTELADQIRDSGNRGIAAGDFNATPWNEGYQAIAGLLRNAHARAGWGPGFTFPSRARRMGMLFPYVRIDHVFADERFVPLRAFVGQASPGADHHPVVVDYAFSSD
jgi:endonuclease/exonuclease/phosphatase (EEP) superfamily protein YafD